MCCVMLCRLLLCLLRLFRRKLIELWRRFGVDTLSCNCVNNERVVACYVISVPRYIAVVCCVVIFMSSLCPSRMLVIMIFGTNTVSEATVISDKLTIYICRYGSMYLLTVVGLIVCVRVRACACVCGTGRVLFPNLSAAVLPVWSAAISNRARADGSLLRVRTHNR